MEAHGLVIGKYVFSFLTHLNCRFVLFVIVTEKDQDFIRYNATNEQRLLMMSSSSF
jgi:hypothetical protein